MERTRPSFQHEPTPEETDALDLRSVAERSGPALAAEAEIGEATARDIWRTAARLQAEAARRLDERSETLASEQRPSAVPHAAFSRAEVEEIAQAAGIDPSFVALAWREVEAARHHAPVSDDRQRQASAFLGTDAERLAVTRTFRAAPGDVLAAMQRVLPADPYRLTLVDVLGESDDMADSALLFDVPQIGKQVQELGRYTAFSYAMSVCDLTRVVITLHDLGDGRTEATIAADLRHGKGRNLTVGRWSVGLVAALSAVIAGWIGLASSGPVGAVMAATMAAIVMGWVVHLAYPPAYRRGLGKGERALGDLLSAVDVDLRSGGAFRPPSAPPSAGPESYVIAV